MREFMPELIGNERLRHRLGQDIINNSYVHAYIISGEHGTGRHKIATMFAAAVACENRISGNAELPLPCLRCSNCKKILEGKSPDVITVSKTGQSVKIEQIRQILEDIHFVPNDLEDKFYIIEDADTMTKQAQNAFLLTLEEPPAYAHFFLLCEKSDKLLETIRSRAPELRTEPVDSKTLKDYVVSHSKTADNMAKSNARELDEIISISKGSVGRALELMDEEERNPIIYKRKTARELVELALQKQIVPLVKLILALPQKQDELIPILTLAEVALRDLAALKKSPEANLEFYTERDEATEISYSCSLNSIMSLYANISETVDTVSRNANIKLSLTSMLSRI